jgi:hypothetical protein
MTTAKSLNLTSNSAGEYRGKPFYGVEVTLFKERRTGKWVLLTIIDGVEGSEEHRTFKEALIAIDEIGFHMIPTKNCLTGKECKIERCRKGTVCDPAMESYHSF